MKKENHYEHVSRPGLERPEDLLLHALAKLREARLMMMTLPLDCIAALKNEERALLDVIASRSLLEPKSREVLKVYIAALYAWSQANDPSCITVDDVDAVGTVDELVGDAHETLEHVADLLAIEAQIKIHRRQCEAGVLA